MNDAYWDELGIAWRATVPDTGLAVSKLEARLGRQEALTRIGVAIGVGGGLLALGLAAWTVWIGANGHAWNFVTRGVSIAVVGILMLFAASSLGGGGRGAGGSLRDMLELSMRRAERQARAAGLALLAVGVLAVGGLAGYAVRARMGRPPAMSPVDALLALAVLGLALLWIRHGQARAARTCRHLTQALALDEA